MGASGVTEAMPWSSSQLHVDHWKQGFILHQGKQSMVLRISQYFSIPGLFWVGLCSIREVLALRLCLVWILNSLLRVLEALRPLFLLRNFHVLLYNSRPTFTGILEGQDLQELIQATITRLGHVDRVVVVVRRHAKHLGQLLE